MPRPWPLALSLVLLACPPKPDSGGDSPPEGDTDADTDTDTDTDTVPAPSLHIALTRADEATAFAPVAVTVTALDATGAPWSGELTLTAVNPGGWFAPELDPVAAGEAGTWSTTVRADRSGEVRLSAEATIDGGLVQAEATVLFVPFLATGWDVPRAVEGVNSPGPEDSISISPDGETLFFSYTPLSGCNFMPAGLGDDPETEACRVPANPFGTPERPCTNGLDDDGLVTLGLFGDTDAWPWPKAMEDSYVVSRLSDGSFGAPVCISFDDDGTLMEVSPTSGPASPVPGEAYDLFFGYPDWLNVDLEHDGSVYAVATVTAGQSTLLSDPITAISSPPGNVLARPLTGPMNEVRESAAVVGEFRVFEDPDAGPQLWFEIMEQGGVSADIVVSALTGIYPEGDWAAPEPLPAPINTDAYHETFPWPVVLDDGAGPVRHVFFNRGPLVDWTAPTPVLDSTWSDGAWGEPEPVLVPEITGLPGSIIIAALPSVSSGEHGVELFFVYVVLGEDGAVDLQVGVAPRR